MSFRLVYDSQKCFVMVRLTALSTIVFVMMSCGQHGANLQLQLQSSVDANAESVTHTDWETSDFHPKFLFGNLRSDLNATKTEKDTEKIKKDLCTAFKNLSDDNLLVFESEILNEENRNILSQCKALLMSRLNDKNTLNRQQFKYSTDGFTSDPSNIDFKLEVKTVTNADYMSFNRYHGSVDDKEVVLTFDDGPHNYFTSSILKTLREAGDLKAMFFELGRQIEKYPHQTQKAFADGHVIANHSWQHLCLNNTETCRKNNKGRMLTDNEVQNDIISTFELIKKTVGKMAPFFRYPYGDDRESIANYLKKSGVHEMHWSIDSNDWRYSQKVGSETIPFTSKEVLASALRTIDKHNRGVVLFHDIHRRTAEILPQFLYELHKRNIKIVIYDQQNTEPSFK